MNWGFDAPLIGPVLQRIVDTLFSSSGVGVNATGNQITLSIGTVAIRTDVVVHPTGSAIALSAGSVHRPTNVAGNLISITTGGVAISTDNDATVGVSGAAITFGIGTPTFITTTNVFPIGQEITLTAGLIHTPESVLILLVGNEITFNVGTVGINSLLARSFDASQANFQGLISDLVVEDDYDLYRSHLGGVPSGATVTDAWLTIKVSENDAEADAIIQKHITAAGISGQGQIIDGGAVTGFAQLVFQIMASETNLLVADQAYFYDIQERSDTGKMFTAEKGLLIPIGQVTDTP
jgi:hypothetical protein